MNPSGTLFKWLSRILILHLLLVAAQALIAGSFMSGNDAALLFHALVARLILGICVLQIVVTILLRRRGGCPNWVLVSAFAILICEAIEIYSGMRRGLVLHIPLALGIYGGIMRQGFWAIRESRSAKEVTL